MVCLGRPKLLPQMLYKLYSTNFARSIFEYADPCDTHLSELCLVEAEAVSKNCKGSSCKLFFKEIYKKIFHVHLHICSFIFVFVFCFFQMW